MVDTLTVYILVDTLTVYILVDTLTVNILVDTPIVPKKSVSGVQRSATMREDRREKKISRSASSAVIFLIKSLFQIFEPYKEQNNV